MWCIPVSTGTVTNQLLPRVSLVTVAMSVRALNRKVAQCTLSWPSDCLSVSTGGAGIEAWVGGDGMGIGFPLYAVRVLRSRLARSFASASRGVRQVCGDPVAIRWS